MNANDNVTDTLKQLLSHNSTEDYLEGIGLRLKRWIGIANDVNPLFFRRSAFHISTGIAVFLTVS